MVFFSERVCCVEMVKHNMVLITVRNGHGHGIPLAARVYKPNTKPTRSLSVYDRLCACVRQREIDFVTQARGMRVKSVPNAGAGYKSPPLSFAVVDDVDASAALH